MRTKLSRNLHKRARLGYSLVFLLIAASVLGYLVYSQWDVLSTYDWDIDWLQVVIAFVVFSLDLLLVVIVWSWLMDNIGSKVNLITHFVIYSLSNITKRIPGTIWYIASRAQLYKSHLVDAKLTSVASGVEYAISTLSSVFVSLLFALQIILRYGYSPVLFVVVIVIGMIMIHPKVISWILNKLNVEASTLPYRILIKSLLMYVLIWILGGIILFLIANSIYPLQFSNLSYIIGAWSLVGFITSVLLLSPSNLGITEVGLSLLLTNIMPSSIAVIIAVLSRVLITIFEVFWAGISFFLQRTTITQKD